MTDTSDKAEYKSLGRYSLEPRKMYEKREGSDCANIYGMKWLCSFHN